MSEHEPLMQEIAALTRYTVALVALAGLIVGIAPSSFPPISVAAGLATGRGAASSSPRRIEGLWLSAGFVLGIVTVDTLPGATFGFAGLAVLRVLASYLALTCLLLAVVLVVVGLARGVQIMVAATVAGSAAHFRHTRTFTLWAERISAALVFAAALYFLYRAARYAGWLSP